jgi:hypothetical protein
MTAHPRLHRYTKQDPCPICRRYGTGPTPHCHGFVSDDGEWVRCTSEAYANGALLDERCEPPAYIHRRTPGGGY